MKKAMVCLLLFFGCYSPYIFAQQTNLPKEVESPTPKINQFWFVMIKTGPNQQLDSATKASLLKGHMSNIEKLYKEGILKVAGPFGKNDNQWRGIFVFDCPSKEDAIRYTQTDPAISAGLFMVDIIPWFTLPEGNFKPGIPDDAKKE